MARRKRMAFTAPKTAEIKATIKRNAETSPFLRLPLEVKRKIYTEVLGGRQILITRTKAKGLHGDAPLDFASLLATSRRIYVEANPIFWSTNSFNFTQHLAFGAWMKKRNKTEKTALRSLSFFMEHMEYSQHWLRSLSPGVIKQLPGIVNLQLQIELFKFGSGSNFNNKAGSLDLMYTLDPYLAPVRNLGRLPLTRVEVDIRPGIPQGGFLLDGHGGRIPCIWANAWRAPDRQRYADVIERMLLDPNPAETEAKLEVERIARGVEWASFPVGMPG